MLRKWYRAWQFRQWRHVVRKWPASHGFRDDQGRVSSALRHR